MKQKPRTNRRPRPKKTPLHHVRMSALPHRGNAYRPHLIRWQGIVLVVLLAFGLIAAQNFARSGSVLGDVSDVSRDSLLAETNQARAQYNESQLTLNAELNQAAEQKAKNMMDEQYWAHVAPSGATPWQWISQSGYQYAYAGENLAKGFISAEGVITAWLNSPEHRENLLKNQYEDVGFAVLHGELEGEQTTLVVAMYGQAAASQLDQPAVLAANGSAPSLLTRIGVAVSSMSPAMVGALTLLMLTSMIALLAHAYRHQLPQPMRTSWRRHHGLFKSLGMASLVVVVTALYGGGQI